jgi:recombinational DNA repair protein (RecF pathway)
MAYHTYTTDALVLESSEGIAADRTVVLFTREVGLVHGRAVSVRRENSKLRYGLQDFSRLTVSLVQGRHGWRIIGAERCTNLYFRAAGRPHRAALLRSVRLLRRLVRGESADTALYDQLVADLVHLTGVEESAVPSAERVLSLRLLASLGYVAPHTAYAPVLAARSPQEACDLLTTAASDASVRAIDRALSVSHL